MEITLLFILMKYSRYMSHFIGLVHINDLVVINTWGSCLKHICILQVSRWWWYAKFAFYSCCIEMTLIGSVWILYLRLSVEFHFGFLSVSTYLVWSWASQICSPFASYSYIIVLNSDPHACRYCQNMFFYNCQTCKQILIIVLN